MRTFISIENKYKKNIGRQIFNGNSSMGIVGILPEAHKSNTKIHVVETKTAGIATLQDLGNLTSQLKADYIRNAVLFLDKKVIYETYYEEAADGHLKLEQFDYSNGMVGLRTPERVIPIVFVDSSFFEVDVASNDGFANYETFSGSGIIKSGYTPSQFVGTTKTVNNVVYTATVNTGKAVAILADWKAAYTLANSSVVRLGYDQSFGNLLLNGYVWGGKIGYVGGAPTTTEAITILTVK
jgi:hypothetical protein